MRIPILLTSLALALPALHSYAEASPEAQIVRADQLMKQDRPQAAIAILELLLRPDAHDLDDFEAGVALSLLGSSYLNLQMYDQARRCYESAAQKLKSIPSARVQYAAAIDNLGSVEGLIGQVKLSRTMRESALRIYEELGDHAGIARTSSDLAMTAIQQRDFKTARRSLARAFAEAQGSTQLDDDDLASMYSVKGALAAHDEKYQEAVAAYGQAIDFVSHGHTPDYFMRGIGYSLRARAFAQSGDLPNAIADMQQALAILERATGRDSPAYLRAQMTYAQILRDSGAREEASRLEKAASSALADFERRQCAGCTISGESFR